jgi:hypothetical protein
MASLPRAPPDAGAWDGDAELQATTELPATRTTRSNARSLRPPARRLPTRSRSSLRCLLHWPGLESPTMPLSYRGTQQPESGRAERLSRPSTMTAQGGRGQWKHGTHVRAVLWPCGGAALAVAAPVVLTVLRRPRRPVVPGSGASVACSPFQGPVPTAVRPWGSRKPSPATHLRLGYRSAAQQPGGTAAGRHLRRRQDLNRMRNNTISASPATFISPRHLHTLYTRGPPDAALMRLFHWHASRSEGRRSRPQSSVRSSFSSRTCEWA